MRRICNLRENLVFMDKDSILINGVRILGCTLWSFIPPHARDICEYSLVDYRQIMVSDNNGQLVRLTAEISSAWFEDEFNWIKEEVGQSVQRGEQSVVILTHHTPSFCETSAPIYNTHPFLSHSKYEKGQASRWINCCFSSDLEDFIKQSPTIKVWAYGHTHHNNDQIIHNTRLISNQRGYLHGMSYNYSNRCAFYVSA